MRKVATGGSRFVLEARLVNMKKFAMIIFMYSVANPLLYLLAIGAGVGTLINRNSGGIDGVLPAGGGRRRSPCPARAGEPQASCLGPPCVLQDAGHGWRSVRPAAAALEFCRDGELLAGTGTRSVSHWR